MSNSPKSSDSQEPGTKRVLLLEDDPSFREILKEFLSETGHAVREAQSGVEGIKEVLAGDFALILCDMQMPGLAGDLFYRAVERTRPHLCGRFIFITGYRGDAKANDFISAIGGTILLKPFTLDQLLEAMGEKESRRQPAPAIVAAPEPEPKAEPPPPPVKTVPEAVTSPEKQVLLVEDDTFFREAIKEFLSQSGYTVREAQGGAEAIQEVQTHDFEVILCDMQVPGVPGDLFYQAIERMRPHLCERFIFMTGYQGDATINDFLQSVRGQTLLKPFPLDNLREAIKALGEPRPIPPEAPLRQVGTPASSPAPLKAVGASAKHLAKAVTSASTIDSATSVESREQSEPVRSALQRLSTRTVLLAGLVVAGLALFGWHSLLASRCAALSAELAGADKEWADLSKQMREGRISEKLQAELAYSSWLEKNRAASKWTGVLEVVAASSRGDVALQGLRAREMPGLPGACELRVDGLCIGANGRETADGFRRKLEQELQKDQSNAPVKTGFLWLEEEPASSSTPPDQRRVTFEIVATVRIESSPIFKRIIPN